jgi:hypothetical protein
LLILEVFGFFFFFFKVHFGGFKEYFLLDHFEGLGGFILSILEILGSIPINLKVSRGASVILEVLILII